MHMGIDGLTIESEIGRGGFGVVHLALDEAHGRRVAVKTLTGSLDDSARRRFDRERRAMGTLSGHPHIGVVHTSGFTPNGQAYIVMEHLSGGSLEARLEAGPMAVGEVIEIGKALADALETAHQSGVLHLDIKPANVLFSAFGRPKLVDFGIAAIVGDEQATTTIRATPAFAAPEIFDGQPASPASDIYGLAATMYALLMGGAPYTTTGEESALQILREVAVAPVPVVDRADVAQPLRQLLGEAMAKDPAQRPPSMAHFRARLDAAGQAPVAPSPPPAPAPVASSPPPAPAPVGAPPAPPPLAGGPSGPIPTPVPAPANPNRGNRIGVALLGLAAVIAIAAGALVLTRDDGGSDPDPTPRVSTAEPTAAPTVEPTTPPEQPTLEPVTQDPTPLPTPVPTTTPTPAGSGPIVPSVVGLDEIAATTALTNAGYVPVVNPHCFLEAAGTFPAAGAELSLGSMVEVVFEPCIVPDFVGLTLDEAVALVQDINAMRIEWPAHCDDVVLGQSIAAGTIVAPFSTTIFLDLPSICS